MTQEICFRAKKDNSPFFLQEFSLHYLTSSNAKTQCTFALFPSQLHIHTVAKDHFWPRKSIFIAARSASMCGSNQMHGWFQLIIDDQRGRKISNFHPSTCNIENTCAFLRGRWVIKSRCILRISVSIWVTNVVVGTARKAARSAIVGDTGAGSDPILTPCSCWWPRSGWSTSPEAFTGCTW